MVKLGRESLMATDLYFRQLIQDLRAEGVRLNESNQVTGHCMYFDEPNVFQIVVLDRKIVRLANSKLQKLGFVRRCEFNQVNTHAHISVVSDEDFNKVDHDTAIKIKTKYQDTPCLVTLMGLGIYTFGDDFVAGIEVHVEGLNKIRSEAGLEELRSPHITTSYMHGSVFKKGFKNVMAKCKQHRM